MYEETKSSYRILIRNVILGKGEKKRIEIALQFGN